MRATLHDYQWMDGQTAVYSACARHDAALARLDDFERELDIALDCPDCLAAVRPDTQENPS